MYKALSSHPLPHDRTLKITSIQIPRRQGTSGFCPFPLWYLKFPLTKMHFFSKSLIAASVAFAAEPFLYAPDTGLETYLLANNWTEGSQPLLKDMRGIPDFEFAASNYLTDQQFSFYRTAAAGEWSEYPEK